jgi:hypothetical protein
MQSTVKRSEDMQHLSDKSSCDVAVKGQKKSSNSIANETLKASDS